VDESSHLFLKAILDSTVSPFGSTEITKTGVFRMSSDLSRDCFMLDVTNGQRLVQFANKKVIKCTWPKWVRSVTSKSFSSNKENLDPS